MVWLGKLRTISVANQWKQSPLNLPSFLLGSLTELTYGCWVLHFTLIQPRQPSFLEDYIRNQLKPVWVWIQLCTVTPAPLTKGAHYLITAGVSGLSCCSKPPDSGNLLPTEQLFSVHCLGFYFSFKVPFSAPGVIVVWCYIPSPFDM